MPNESLQPFLDHLVVEKGASARTVEAYRRDVTFFLETARQLGVLGGGEGRDGWSGLAGQRDPVRTHLALLRRVGRSRATVDRHLASIRSFYRFLKLTGIIDTVPDNLVWGRGGRERKLPHDLNERLLEDLLALLDPATARGRRDRAMLELIYGLGLRLAELVGLDLAAVDLPGDRITVLGKGSRERVLPLLGCAAEALVEHLEAKLEPAVWRDFRAGVVPPAVGRQPVFEGRPGRRIARRTVQARVQRYAEQLAGLRGVSPHTLRHSFASHLLDGGAGIRIVQELLGHRNLSTTQIYTHLSRAQVRDAFLRAHPRARGTRGKGDSDEDEVDDRARRAARRQGGNGQ